MTATPWRSALAAAVLVLGRAAPAAAQIDYRNLDDDRPVRTEDAYALERYAFELLVPWAVERGRGGTVHQAFIPELAYGLAPNLHVGLKAPLAGTDPGPGGTTWGLAGLRLFALYNFMTEGPAYPALSVRLDAYPSVGGLGGRGVRGGLTLIATRGIGRQRLHVNGGWGLGDFSTRAEVEGGERWWAGLAADRTLFRQSLLVVAESRARGPAPGEPVEVTAAVGFRWQWTPTLVLDAGLTRRLGRAGPDAALTVGLSHAFAVGALMPRGRADTTTTRGGADAPHHH